MGLTMVLAADEDGTIGADGHLPWPTIPADLVHFKTLTAGGHLIMGRKTFDSLPGGRPLRGRHNIVLSHTDEWAVGKHITVARNTSEALAATGYNKAFVVGGAHIFRTFAPMTLTVYLTRVEGHWPGDVRVDLDELLADFAIDPLVIGCPATDKAPPCQIMRFNRMEFAL